jgi:phosphoglycolate phosphatase-like HAD superfamily hydrolase
MHVISNEAVYCFDIDKTMVSARRSRPDPYGNPEIAVRNPYTFEQVYVTPHTGHIDLLKEMKGRERFIVVWSAAGAQWARTIIEALELQSYVDVIITKPHGYVDDQKAEQFMKNHIYLEPGDRT